MSGALEVSDEHQVHVRLAVVQEILRRPDLGLSGGRRPHVRWANEVVECATILSNMVLGVADPPKESEE